MARDLKESILCLFVIVGFIVAVGYGRATSDRGPIELSQQHLAPADVCVDGETIDIVCNTCTCTNGGFDCTSNSCSLSSDKRSKREAIFAGFVGDKSRSKRETPLTADLKNTPCAPNDYFQIDCNTCYCKIDRSGYLCTENIACEKNIESSTTTQIPMSEGAVLIITDHGAQLVKDSNNNDNNLSRIGKSLGISDHTSPIQVANSLAGISAENTTTPASAKH